MTLTKSNITKFQEILQIATRNELDYLDSLLQKEIRLSETSIREGFEKRR